MGASSHILSLSYSVCSKSLNPDLRSGTHTQLPRLCVCVRGVLRSHLGLGCLFNANFEHIKIASAQKYATHFTGWFVRPEKWVERVYLHWNTSSNTYVCV